VFLMLCVPNVFLKTSQKSQDMEDDDADADADADEVADDNEASRHRF
jgi:hypothetical protein